MQEGSDGIGLTNSNSLVHKTTLPERAPQYRVLCIPTVYVCLFIYMHVRRAVYVSAMRFIPFLRKTQKKDNFKVHVSVIVNSNGSSW